MKVRFSSRTRLLLTLALLLTISPLTAGCESPPPEAEKPDIASYDVPLESTVSVRLSYFNEAELAQGNKQLVQYTNEINVERGRTTELAAVEELLKEPGPDSGFVSIGAGWVCRSVDVVRNYSPNMDQCIAFIDISIPPGMEQDNVSYFRNACSSMLSSLSGVDYVVVTVDGKLPLNMENGLESTGTVESVAGEKPMLLYYPGEAYKHAIPVVRTVQSSVSNTSERAELVFNELKKSSENPQLGTIYPSEVIFGGLELPEDDNNLIIVKLYGPKNYVTGWDSQHDIRNACLALSLFNMIQGRSVIKIVYSPDPGSYQSWPEMSWTYDLENLNGKRGGFIPVYLGDRETPSLRKIQRIKPFHIAADPYACVAEVLEGPLETEDNSLVHVVPMGVGSEDFLGCSIYRDILVVYFSDNFYERCAGLSEENERLLVYAIINALTENPSVKQVLFVSEEGVNVETLSGYLVLSQPLLRNPGIVRQ